MARNAGLEVEMGDMFAVNISCPAIAISYSQQ